VKPGKPAAQAQRQAQREAEDMRERLRGLKPAQAQQLRQVMRWMASGDLLMAGQWLLDLSLTAPDHPEVLRWRGLRHFRAGEWTDAADCLARSAMLRPGDFDVLSQLATAQDHAGDHFAAPQSLRAARELARDAAQWLTLSLEFDRQGHVEEALAAVQRALEIEPGAPVALLQRARCARTLGQAERAAEDCRTLIAARQFAARAWFMLVDLKTVLLSATEFTALGQAAVAPSNSAADRLLLEFAWGKALEDAGRHAEAFAAFERANRDARVLNPWDAEAFSRRVDAVSVAFSSAPAAVAREQGREVIFLVGLPRSGTTLVEQVLASHSQVEGASELPYLNSVIEEESRRRAQAFPNWVATANADDWTRLGQRYLGLSARWRAQRPVATDKLPENWLLVGAALRMLPAARVIDCRRDAVETCWSCWKQLFGPQQVGFTYGFDTLAAYWHDYDRLCRQWARQFPGRFRAQRYEDLVADPEGQIRALLDFCGLAFEPGCLEFHKAERAIRTPSALQVRQPLRRTSTPAAGYGELLAPLRRLLAPV
jgi:tetratricopeptide (TPR) repeat protein